MRGGIGHAGSWALEHPYRAIFVVALIPRLLLVAASGLLTDFALDDAMYNQMATSMAEGEIAHWDDFTYSLYWRTATFLGPVTLIYKVLGANPIYGQVLVALVGAATAVVVVRLACEVVKPRWALGAGLVIALLPSQAFWSSQLMKDAFVWFTVAAIATLVAVANRSTGSRLAFTFIGIAIAMVALSFLREHTLVVAAWALVIASMAGRREQRVARIAGAVLLCVAIPWVAAGIGPAGSDLVTNAGSLGTIRFRMAQGANTAIVDTTPGGTEAELNRVVMEQKEISAAISQETAGETAGETTGETRGETRGETNAGIEGCGDTEPSAGDSDRVAELKEQLAALCERQARIQGSPGAVLAEQEAAQEPDLKHLPRGISVMLLEPLPIPFTGSTSLRLARIESLIWYPLLVFAALGLWRARRCLAALAFPILAGGGILIMYALTEGNIGTAHRHRGEFVWVVAVLTAVGIAHTAKQRRANASSDA